MLDNLKSRGQMKGSPWSTRLGFGRDSNYAFRKSQHLLRKLTVKVGWEMKPNHYEVILSVSYVLLAEGYEIEAKDNRADYGPVAKGICVLRGL
jgi:hypothetical protein